MSDTWRSNLLGLRGKKTGWELTEQPLEWHSQSVFTTAMIPEVFIHDAAACCQGMNLFLVITRHHREEFGRSVLEESGEAAIRQVGGNGGSIHRHLRGEISIEQLISPRPAVVEKWCK
ncbi:hypothetical protein ACOME3_008784 [Neoechinorhynchus agilis]